MVTGPDMACEISEFESFEERRKTDIRHYEQTKHVQMAFAQDVKTLAETIEDMGNPFSEKGSDLLVLDTRDLADPVVNESLNHIEKLVRDQYYSYVSEHLVSQSKPITDPIPKNNLPLFSRPPVREISKSQQQLSSLKNDCSLFSRLCIASQIHDVNLDDFFAHENQACPPSISLMEKLRIGTKSDLLGSLEDLVPSQGSSPSPCVQVSIIDGAAILNML